MRPDGEEGDRRDGGRPHTAGREQDRLAARHEFLRQGAETVRRAVEGEGR